MYLDFLVDLPYAPGKLVTQKKGDTTYLYYEIGRTYNPSVQYTTAKRVTIGKLSKSDLSKIQPNENFIKYFPDITFPDESLRSARSSCIKIGAYIVIKKILEDYKIPDILRSYFDEKDCGLFLDLAVYSIITESNVAQHYPDYTYNHPLFTSEMKMYSDSAVSEFFKRVTREQSSGFLNEWNENRDHREKIYISYDATNKNSQSGDIEKVEYGKAKVDMGTPIFNYAIAYDSNNREPLFYEDYPGSINDTSQLRFMLDKANAHGYKKIGFILERGYFSKGNIESMDRCGYSFVIMVKGMANFVNKLVLENKGFLENKRKYNIPVYGAYGMTIRKKLYDTDEKERYFHIYHSISKESAERRQIENKIEQMTAFLERHRGESKNFGPSFEKYFELIYDKSEHSAFVVAREKEAAIERELNLSGYYCIVTSEKMTAKEALELYKSRDASEKLFRGDKSYLGDKSLRVHSDESMSAKIFMEFIALIVRNKIYTCLKDAVLKMDKNPNYMTVPAALRELGKIEMSRYADRVYRLDHAVTATQKTILSAFGMDADYIKYKSEEISERLKCRKSEGIKNG